MSGRREVDDRQAAKGECDTARCISPLPTHIGAAVMERVRHLLRLQGEFVAIKLTLEIDETGNAAHRVFH